MKKKAAVLGALALFAGAVFATASSSAGAAEEGTEIRSWHNNRCLTVAHFNAGDGASVHMYDCNGATTQKWVRDRGRLRNVFGNKCLVPSIGNGENGASLSMYTCDFGGAGGWQVFYRSAQAGEEGRIRTLVSPNRCIEISGGNWWQGASVQLWDCAGGNHQRWTAP